MARAGGDPRTFFGHIFGEEKNLTTSIARMNLVLHGVEDFRIEQNDTLRRPAFTPRTGVHPHDGIYRAHALAVARPVAYPRVDPTTALTRSQWITILVL